MSTQSRRLVQRSRPNNENSSPAQRGGGRPRDAPAAREPAALPPYEAPRFPLTATARRDLENLRENHDYSKYKKHLDSAIKTITASAAEINDELSNREERIRRRDEKRGDDEKTEEDKQVEGSTRAMGKKVRGLTAEAEQAVRELIDYGDELSMQETMMRDVSQTIAEAPVVERRAPRRRNREVDAEKGGENDEDASEDGEDEPEEDPNVPSAIELLKQAKLDYRIQYAAKTMRERYEVNDYRQFKNVVHDAQNHGDDVPVPHANTWFPEDNANQSSSSRRRQNNTTDNTSNADDSDNDIVIQRSTTSLKCPLTLLTFKEPYTSLKCKHTFEKETILEYHRSTGTMFAQPGQPGRGTKIAKCPQPGCDSMFGPDDLYHDLAIVRKVERAKRREEEENAESSDDDDARPRGNQKNRPTAIDSDDEIDEEEAEQKKKIARVKRERQQSRRPSMAGRAQPDEDDDDVMDVD